MSQEDRSVEYGKGTDGKRSCMKRDPKGIKYKLNLQYPDVKFEAQTVSLPIKGVELKVSYWIPNMSYDDVPVVKDKYKKARQLLLKNINRDLFSEKFIYILDYPNNIVTKKSYICWTFHLYTRGEVNRKDITENLQVISHKLYSDILSEQE